jgi:hypothetical protein
MGQHPSANFCPAWKAISHNPNADRTGTPTDTFAHVKQVEERYSRKFFSHCGGVVSVGLERVSSTAAPAHSWVIGIDVLTRDLPSGHGHSYIDGVRLVLRPISKRPKLV